MKHVPDSHELAYTYVILASRANIMGREATSEARCLFLKLFFVDTVAGDENKT